MKVRVAVAPGGAGAEPGGPAGLAALVDGLEAGGFDGIWLSDVPLAPALDPFVGLGFAAGRTRRLRLGANVVPLGRSPLLLAKQLAQLDQVSSGRLLLSFVPGLGSPAERAALGVAGEDRGAGVEATLAMVRAWLAGDAVTGTVGPFAFDGVASPAASVQRPLEVWLGGHGPKALDRIGRVADGWLGAAVTPEEAGAARRRIDEAAAAAGRTVDPEHHGLSIPYCRDEAPDALLAGLRARRPDVDPALLVAVGRDGLRSLVGRLVEQGLSKFVVRPAHAVASWEDELAFLADAVVPLQT